jgi:hypothetical protein
MPKMRYDKYDASNTKSEGEKHLIKAFSESKDIDDWIILHSLDILHNKFRTQGEADFVILAPKLGVLVIEVKDSPSIERTSSGDWIIGGTNPQRGSPFKQASESMWNVRNYLDTMKVDTKKVNFFYAVWFTKAQASKFGNSIEWKESQILGAEHLASGAVKAMKAKFQQQAKSLMAHENSPASMAKIANTIKPSVPLNGSPIDNQKLIDENLKMAIEQQKKLFELFDSIGRYVVSGLAGTGKTFLAIGEAQKAHWRAEPTLLLCFNSLLAVELKKKLQDFPSVKVSTIHALMSEAVGEDFRPGESSDYWADTLPKLAIEKLLGTEERPLYQTLIIDEAQDFGNENFLDFLDLMLDKGLAKSRVILFGDFLNQAIYSGGASALDIFRKRIPDLVVPDTLRVNCRNTVQVGEFVAEIISLNPSYSKFLRSDEMTKVDMNTLSSGVSPKNLLVKVIDAQRKLFPPKSIVILSAQKEKLRSLLLTIPGKFRRLDESEDTAIRFGSIHEFKGLEASSVILVEFEDGGGSIRDHFYIASTRSTANFTFILPESFLDKLVGSSE